MLTSENICDALHSAKGSFPETTELDIAFLVLCDNFEDKTIAYRCTYLEEIDKSEVRAFLMSAKISNLSAILKPFGVGINETLTLSSEQNMSAMVQTLNDIRELRKGGTIDPDLIKLEADIRFKIQSKFDLQQDNNEAKHIIIVPQKHDYICPHTNRECSSMASKEACMKYYNLVEQK